MVIAPGANGPAHTLEWLIGEALTNLYVGLGRFHRGERLSALRLIQVFAVDRILELAHFVEEEQVGPPGATHTDKYAAERRFEKRFPMVASELPGFIQGYDRSPESAAAILTFLEGHWEVNSAMAQALRGLLALPLTFT